MIGRVTQYSELRIAEVTLLAVGRYNYYLWNTSLTCKVVGDNKKKKNMTVQ